MIRILGVPMDLGASRRGTDMGPSALRIAGVASSLRALGLEVEREQDIAVPSMETRDAREVSRRFKREIFHVCERLATRVRKVLEEDSQPLILGGDHSIAMGSVAGVSSYFHARGQALGLLWIDAHGDMNTPRTSPSGNIHGMPLAHLLGHGDPELCGIGGFSPKVLPEHVALLGIRDLDGGERKLIRDSGVHAYTMREIDERGMASVAAEAIAVIRDGTAGFHVSFDVDGLDPEVAPGVGTPVPGGISYREAHLLFELIADSRKMVSCEVVELNPVLDQGNASARVVQRLLLSAFGQSIL